MRSAIFWNTSVQGLPSASDAWSQFSLYLFFSTPAIAFEQPATDTKHSEGLKIKKGLLGGFVLSATLMHGVALQPM